MEAARQNSVKLVKQILDIAPSPTSILVAGKIARKAFDAYLRPNLPLDVQVAYVPHPGARVSNEEFKQRVIDALVQRRSLTTPN